MKYLIYSMLILLLSRPEISHAEPLEIKREGGHVGNGGSHIIHDFQAYGVKFVAYLRSGSALSEFKVIQPDELEKRLKSTFYFVERKKTAPIIEISVSPTGNQLVSIGRARWRELRGRPMAQMREALKAYIRLFDPSLNAEAMITKVDTEIAFRILNGAKVAEVTLSPFEADVQVVSSKEREVERSREEELRKALLEEKQREQASEFERYAVFSSGTLRCVQKILMQRRGGEAGIKKSHELLTKLKDARKEKNEKLLEEIESSCSAYLKATSEEPGSSMDRRVSILQYTGGGKAERSILKTINDLGIPVLVRCRNHMLSVRAGFAAYASAGVKVSVCTFSDGKRVLAVGPEFGGSPGGAGAEIDFVTEDVTQIKDDNTDIRMSTFLYGTMIGQYSLHPARGASLIVDFDQLNTFFDRYIEPIFRGPRSKEPIKDSQRRFNTIGQRFRFSLGAMAAFDEELSGISAAVQVPVFPLSRDWTPVLETLDKSE